MTPFEIAVYQTEAGEAPFQIWLDGLPDIKAKVIVFSRIERAASGLFGDWKMIADAKGVREMRIHYGQGYRVFYSVIGQKLVLLLAGSSKQSQGKAISTAKTYLSDYLERTKP